MRAQLQQKYPSSVACGDSFPPRGEAISRAGEDFLLKKADAADGTGSEGQIQLFRALSTALVRSAEHSLEAITMTTRSPLAEMMAFSTLLCACANSA